MQTVDERSLSVSEINLGLRRTISNCVTNVLRGHCKVGVPYCKPALKQCWLSTAHPAVLNRLAFCVLYFCVGVVQHSSSKPVNMYTRNVKIILIMLVINKTVITHL